ncbi:MAG: tyrosine-type recombinase/integrase [Acidimicrobiia bacterium]
MGRRNNGEGTVYRDHRRGGWIAAKKIDGRMRQVSAPTKAGAVERLRSLEAETAYTVDQPGMNVAQLLDTWSERVLAGRSYSPATVESYRWALDLLTVELGEVLLARLDVDEIESSFERLARRAHRPLGRRSLKLVRSVLSQVLDYGQRRRLITGNPCVHVELPSHASRPRERVALDLNQVRTLWRALESEPYGDMFRLQMVTGLRPAEVAGLCWDSVDLERGLLVVRRSVRLRHGVPYLADGLKTASSFRTIAPPRAALEVLEALHHGSMSGLCFRSSSGGPIDPANARRALARITVRAGLPRLSPNELRHTAASVLIDQGVPVELVADLLGHTNLRMLAEHYRHRLRPAADAAVRFDALLEIGAIR